MTQDYSLGPVLGIDREQMLGTLLHVLNQQPKGIALEFGVGSGRSLRLIAERMPVVGFDGFTGLPEDWRDGFPAGTFACEPPEIPGAQLVVGLFEETLFDWVVDNPGAHIGLLHIDCDLYSSTKTVLDNVGHYLAPGSYVVFDEYHGWPGWESDGECLAWKAFANRTGITWTVLGHGPEQWAIQIS